jgi:cysteine desulfurase/selenocysteine lyase
MFGPNGVGVLYVRRDLFQDLELGNVGGGMVAMLADDRFEPLEAPFRYEAGTPNVEGVIGLGAAVDYLLKIGMANVAAHSRALAAQLMEGLAGLPDASVLGRSARERIALATVSMPWPAMRQQDIARLLADAHSIFVSGGFHCAHVLHHRLKLDGTLRASAHLYNDAGDIEAFIRALRDL